MDRLLFSRRLGLLVQVGALWILVDTIGFHYLAATLAATELAIVHNFFRHWRWTWSDRTTPDLAPVWRLARFHLTNGIVSLVGNPVLTAWLTGRIGIHYVHANLIALFSRQLPRLRRVCVPDTRLLTDSLGSVITGTLAEDFGVSRSARCFRTAL